MILVAILFIVLGVLVKNGKAYNLIAGYNTLSPEEKAKVDIKGISIVFRNAMFGMAVIIVAGSLFSYWLDDPSMEWIGLIIAVVIGVPYLLVTTNSDKYKKEEGE